MAADALVAELDQRWAADGVEKVNAYLIAHEAAALNPLRHSTARCELGAVSLSVRLARGDDRRATDAHAESLRIALGRCTGFVLALLALHEVPRFCSSSASWTIMQTVRELRRRMRSIEADAVLRASPRGKACSAAYLHELQTTRVGLRAGPAAK